MSRKPRKVFSEEVKRQAVDDFVNGKKSAAQLGVELEIDSTLIYRWRTEFAAKARSEKLDGLESEGIDPKSAKKILELEAELELYQKKVAEQSVAIDLLKKLHGMKTSRSESELTGLINIVKSSARRRGPVK